MSGGRADGDRDGEGCRLYLLTPPRLDDPAAFAPVLKAALAARPGFVAALQLRLKAADGGAPERDAVLAAAAALLPVARAADVAFLVNDDPDLAAEAGADGVHVGRADASVAAARARLGRDAIVGATCHASVHLAMEAGEAGADYVAFGAFFDSPTKAAATRADPDLLARWSAMSVLPCVAIGGITPGRAGSLAAAGADYLAVASAVWDAPEGPAAAVRRFADAVGWPTEAAG